MIIIISEDLLEFCDSDPNFIDCLEMLMLAYIEGQHLLVIAPKVAKRLSGDSRFSERTSKSLKYYFIHSACESQTILKYFSCAIEVVPSFFEECCYFNPINNTHIRQIKSSAFTDSANIQETVLLGENLSDAYLYEIIGDYFIKEIGLNNISVRCERLGGGGNTTHQLYEEIYKTRNKICVCFLDSDKKSPSSPIGDTSKTVKSFHAKEKNKNLKCSYHISYDFLELENILPLTFYINNFDFPDNEPNCNRYPIKTLSSEAVLFFDFKNGVYCRKICGEQPHQKYWRKQLLFECFDKCPNIGNHDDCKNSKLIGGFGSDILEKFMSYYKSNEVGDLIDSSSLEIFWFEIGHVVANWCSGQKKIRAI